MPQTSVLILIITVCVIIVSSSVHSATAAMPIRSYKSPTSFRYETHPAADKTSSGQLSYDSSVEPNVVDNLIEIKQVLRRIIDHVVS